jgi:5S rRNA maturation endonuclease (ribonuclease M5)
MNSRRKEYSNYNRVNELVNIACDSIEDILSELGVEYHRNYRRIYGPCPIHGGDNPSAFSLYPEGNMVRGIWVCRTHHCEHKWKKTLIGFIHGMLSRTQHVDVTWMDAIDWLCEFLGYNYITDIPEPTENIISKRQYADTIKRFNLIPKETHAITFNRYVIRQHLEIPPQYYIDRGFSSEILDRYDVGLAADGRIIVPIYNDDHTSVVGVTSRSTNPQCTHCKMWHSIDTECPKTNIEIINASKWKHSKNFTASHYLYNYWFAKKYIEKTFTAVIVEGPGDIWRLEENNVHNGVALFGTDLTDDQQIILESSGALSCVILLDNDDAGQQAAVEIKNRLGNSFRLFFPTFIGNDIGDLHSDIITDNIKPFIEKVKRISEV